MTPEISFLEMLARQAGDILREGYNPRPGNGNHLHVSKKGVIDLVTEFDHRSEEFILREIKAHFPADQIVAEESGLKAGLNSAVWFVDPLDGTVNYAHGVPLFAVSIAYKQDGAMQLGVIYDPISDECFTAQHGKGAWLNGQPLHAAQTDSLENSLLVTGFPYDIRTNPENNLNHYARLSLLSQGVRRLGSAALDLCYVAAGRFDGYWEMGLGAWDFAAGALIAQEAGARLSNLQGGADLFARPQSIVAAAPALHSLLLAALAG